MWLVYCVFFALTGCFYKADPSRKARKALRKNNCEQALRFFQDIIHQNQKITLAQKAAKLCLNSAPEISLWFYNYLSQWEKTKETRLLFEKKAGDLAFEKVKNYEQALIIYSSLKKQASSKRDQYFYSFRMAFSYFERGKWLACLKTLQPLLAQNDSSLSPTLKIFQKKALFLKARVLLIQEQYQPAQKTFQKIRKLYPQYFQTQEMALYVSFIHEEQKNFHKALKELETFHHTSGFLREKIKRLKIRKENQPRIGQGHTL